MGWWCGLWSITFTHIWVPLSTFNRSMYQYVYLCVLWPIGQWSGDRAVKHQFRCHSKLLCWPIIIIIFVCRTPSPSTYRLKFQTMHAGRAHRTHTYQIDIHHTDTDCARKIVFVSFATQRVYRTKLWFSYPPKNPIWNLDIILVVVKHALFAVQLNLCYCFNTDNNRILLTLPNIADTTLSLYVLRSSLRTIHKRQLGKFINIFAMRHRGSGELLHNSAAAAVQFNCVLCYYVVRTS